MSHVERNCEEKSNGKDKETRDTMLAIIKLLQVMPSPSTESFNHTARLFLTKWSENLNVIKFIAHFKTECIYKNYGWYEGFVDGPFY